MANITRFNPFHELAGFAPFGREMEDLFKGFFMNPMALHRFSVGYIPVNVTEDETSFRIRAEIPGFRKEEIHVGVCGDQVSISAETQAEKSDKEGDQVVMRECHYGKQSRSFTLPRPVDDASAKARFQDGVLELVLTKTGEGSVHQIPIE